MKNHALVLSIVACNFLASCSEKPDKDKPEKYLVVNPIISDTVITNSYVAEISALQNIEIRSRIGGYLEGIHVDEGQSVRTGQLLFTINSKEYQQNLLRARASYNHAVAELKSAEIELKNIEKLYEKQIVSLPELEIHKAKIDALKARIDESESDIEQAKLNLSFTEIRAPFDGVINRIPNKIGSLIEEETLLTSISDNREMFAYYHVSEKDYLEYAISKGEGRVNDVSLILANGHLYDHQGQIETTESEFDKSTGNIAFRARFSNAESLLKHGASGKVLVKSELINAMIIPQKSTFEIQGNIYVFVVDDQNIVHQRKVNPVASFPHTYVVEPSLKKSDRIIFEGIQKVKDGDNVQVELISFSQLNIL